MGSCFRDMSSRGEDMGSRTRRTCFRDMSSRGDSPVAKFTLYVTFNVFANYVQKNMNSTYV
jgi:hypothetical protein